MPRISECIQIDTDSWIVMRELPQHPKAIIHRITDTTGEARFVLLTWHAEPSKRRMVGIHRNLREATRAVPWPDANGRTPPIPESMQRPAPNDVTQRLPLPHRA